MKLMKENFSRYSLLVIKVLLMISIVAFFSTTFALKNENSTELLYEEVQKNKVKNLRLNEWYSSFSGAYAYQTNLIQQANKLYELENNKIKAYNLCARMNAFSSGAVASLSYFFKTYEKELKNKYLIKYNIKNKKDLIIKRRAVKFSPLQNCSNERNKNDYIIKYAVILNNYHLEFLDLILELRSDLYKDEKKLYKKIEFLSSLSSKIYLGSYLLQILLALTIVSLDLYSNRGTNEK